MGSAQLVQMCEKYLFEDVSNIPERYKDNIVRIRAGHVFWYDSPSKTRKEVRDFIVNMYGVTIQQAYDDINMIERIMGSIRNPSKEWMRFRVNSMLEEAYFKAQKQDDPKAMALIADKIGKYNMLDQADQERIPFDQIVPQQFEPTEDPSVLGITRDPEIREKKRKMIEKYAADIEIVDVPYTELPDDEQEDIL